MINRKSILFVMGLALVMYLTILSGCQTPPLRSITEQELLSRQQDYLHTYQSDINMMNAQTRARMKAEYLSALNGGEPQSFDILVLSGGGAFGSFGAGFLEGWGQVTEHEFVRPRFDSISGISTGSLIAPFAFIGTSDTYRTIVEIYENPERDWTRKRSILRYLPGNMSLFDVSKLHAKIRSAITPEIIQTIAQEAIDGRQLLVGAANVDYGLMRVWNLAQTAIENPVDEAREQIISVLLASIAIPGVFPPVVIDDLLYVDGGASMQVVGGLEERNWIFEEGAHPLTFTRHGQPVRIRVWVIVNQRLVPNPELVQKRWTSISTRSLNTLLRTSMLQSLHDLETFVRLIDKSPQFDAKVRYVAIPQNYEIPETDDMFNAEIMRSLVELGRRMGADTTSWRTESLRPGAPFELK